MSENQRLITTTPERVWDVLADGWLYPLWVVGASRVRDVEGAWPEPGSRIHHSVGVWPGLVDDHTEVMESHPQTLLRLLARGWPAGEAEVEISLIPAGPDTQVVLAEKVVSGPGVLVPDLVMEPVLKWRNVETLRRLAYVAERRRP